MNNSIKLYDGFVQVVDHMGSDKEIVDAARVSYDGVSRGWDKDSRLLAYLVRNGHMVPFERGVIVFLVEIPHAIARHLLRYRTISANEISGRYVRLNADKYYRPKRFRIQSKVNKQGSSKEFLPKDQHDAFMVRIQSIIDQSSKLYADMLEAGIAREMSRMYLPHLALYTKIQFKIDVRNLMNFLNQRLDSHAQEETRMFAKAIEKHFANLFPETHKLWKIQFRLEARRKKRAENKHKKNESKNSDKSIL